MARPLSSIIASLRTQLSIATALSSFAVAYAAGYAHVTPSNLERIEQAAAELADSLVLGVSTVDSLCLTVVPHDAAWIVERAIADRATLRGIAIRRCER